MFELIIGNIPGAREPDDPALNWVIPASVSTRAQVKRANENVKPLQVADVSSQFSVSKEKLAEMQEEDISLQKV